MNAQNTRYDVIVIGSGPSGSLAAYELAKRGFSVLLLEKHRLPRYKACGGAVTEKGVKLLDFSIDEVTREATDRITVTLNYTDAYTHKFDHPVMYMTMRSEFDHFLAKKAVEKGAQLLESTCVNRVELNDDSVHVHTNQTRFTAKFVIGAGGVHGVVRKSLGLFSARDDAIALVTESYPEARCKRFEEFHSGCHLDFFNDEMRAGYGWIFPKNDHISPGVYTIDLRTLKQSATLKDATRKYLGNKEIFDAYSHSYHGHPLPRGGIKGRFHRGRALLVGDEGELCDPLTGEGIHFGMMGSVIAAEVLEECLRNNKADLSEYSKRVNKEIVSELAYARLFAYCLYQQSDLAWKFASNTMDKIHKYFAQLMVGKITYQELWSKSVSAFAKRRFQKLIPWWKKTTDRVVP